MSNRKIIILIVLFFVVFIGGYTIGHIPKNLPLIKFKNEVSLYEIFNLLLTLSISIIIPLLVKKWIEDNRLIKVCLVDEVKNIINVLNKINDIVNNGYRNQKISNEDKTEINFLFHKTELLLNL